MSEFQETGNKTVSALRADVSRPTAQKYIDAQQPPAELQLKHTWRTRTDPLEKIWSKAAGMLMEAPDLEANFLFEYLLEVEPWAIEPKHLRTFQRRVQGWKLQHGPDHEVFFPQDWVPGKAMQLDWTNANELAITIANKPYEHLLCHEVLPYSNWEWASRCQSESLLSLRHGLQASLHELGKVTEELRVDNSSAATHEIGAGLDRAFNEDFKSLCAHYGLKPKTIGIGCPHENGDVESGNRHLKRRLQQHLLLRGNRDFACEAAYDEFLHQVLRRANAGRKTRLAQELAGMRILPPTRLSEYDEVICRVSEYSTIRVKKVGYSVPARFIGHALKAEVYENEIKLYAGREHLLTLPRARGDRGIVLDYRHIIEHLLRKPGAFERYRYREELFPSQNFREAHDRMIKDQGPRRGSLEYLRLLKLASEVGHERLELYLVEYVMPPYPAWSVEEMRGFIAPPVRTPLLEMDFKPELGAYDLLLGQAGEEVRHVA